MKNSNEMVNYEKWKEKSTSEYKIDQNVVKDIITSPPYIKEDYYYIPPENIFLKIKNFLCYGFYPFKDLSIDKFVDNMMPSMCSKDCPVLKDNEENTQQACEVCKNAFKEFLLELEE